MSVVEVGDATDIEGLYELSREVGGPLYIRMLRGEVPRIFPTGSRLELNRARVLSRGDDIALMTTGVCTEEALRVTGLIRDAGIGVTHLHVTTLKPFSDPQVAEAIGNARFGAITMENHVAIGGLGSCAAEMIAEQDLGRRLIRVSVGDRYLQGAGTPWLMENYGIGASALVDAVEALAGRTLGIARDRLAQSGAGEFFGDQQMEAL